MAELILKWFGVILGIAYYVGVIIAIFRILLENRNPSKTIAYLIFLLLVPILGMLIYLFFGMNYRQRKIISQRYIHDADLIRRWTEQQVFLMGEDEKELKDEMGEKFKIVKLLLHNERAVLTSGNAIKILTNGEEKFPEVIRDLKAATHHIHIEYFIYIDDQIGREILAILKTKIKSGIEVRLNYDPLGSGGLTRKYIKELKRAGAEVKAFLPPLIPWFSSKANYRNHRKMIIIDGKVGYTGGINVEDKYINDGRSEYHYWRDTHIRIEGEAVKSLQLLFFLSWRFVSRNQLPFSKDYFPSYKMETGAKTQIVGTGPDSDWASIMQAFFLAITTARESICIETPYFIPNEQLMTALKTAALSGVDVQLIIPGVSDSKIVNAATMSFVRPLLKAGVKVYRYQKGFVHAKVMIVDGYFSTVGTANMDLRSFDINFEVNAFMYDETVAERLLADFEIDKGDCSQLSIPEWDKRSFGTKLLESVSRMLAPLL